MSFPKNCAKPGCRSLAIERSTYCAMHQPASRDARHAYRSHYRDPEYKKNRLARLRASGYRCERCGRPVAKGDWECDHVIEVAKWEAQGLPGSPNCFDNLQILCKVDPNRCHYAKTRDSRRH